MTMKRAYPCNQITILGMYKYYGSFHILSGEYSFCISIPLPLTAPAPFRLYFLLLRRGAKCYCLYTQKKTLFKGGLTRFFMQFSVILLHFYFFSKQLSPLPQSKTKVLWMIKCLCKEINLCWSAGCLFQLANLRASCGLDILQ